MLPSLLALILVPFGGAFICYSLKGRKSGLVSAILAGLTFLLGMAVTIWGYPQKQELSLGVPWVQWMGPELETSHFGFLLDPLSSLMLIVITSMGFLVMVYSTEYLSPRNKDHALHASVREERAGVPGSRQHGNGVRQTSDLPLIFLTSKDEEIDEVLGLTMGADDYVKKPFSQRLLLKRVKAVLRRRNAGPAPTKEEEKQIIRRTSLTLDPSRHACLWRGQAVTLTVTEFLILESLAQRPGFVKSRDALMDAAYDDQVYVDDRTIDSHIKRIRKQFRVVDPEFDSIETLYGVGYKYKEI